MENERELELIKKGEKKSANNLIFLVFLLSILVINIFLSKKINYSNEISSLIISLLLILFWRSKDKIIRTKYIKQALIEKYFKENVKFNKRKSEIIGNKKNLTWVKEDCIYSATINSYNFQCNLKSYFQEICRRGRLIDDKVDHTFVEKISSYNIYEYDLSNHKTIVLDENTKINMENKFNIRISINDKIITIEKKTMLEHYNKEMAKIDVKYIDFYYDNIIKEIVDNSII